MPATHSYIDPAALMRVKSLELRAKMIMEGFWRGIHRSPYHGFSVEFSEYRPYTKGDDPRFIDWRVMARTDRAYIKKFEDETNLRAYLIMDRSRSMRFGSGEVTKADYAATLGATLAKFLMDQGDAVGMTSYHDSVQAHIPARNRPGHLRRLMVQFERETAGESTDLSAALSDLQSQLQKRSMCLVFSD
ncbi:MAG: DUF58 domain-containing protein, partial [Verrucomicrobiota bacterium]